MFFNEEWVDYDDRQNYLLDADVGVSTHFEHVETTFSFRTRILDYMWAGLPIVATDGDAFGRLIKAEGMGVGVAGARREGAGRRARTGALRREFAAECRANIVRVRTQFMWDRALAPLIEFCRRPIRAGDAPSGPSRLEARAPRPIARSSLRTASSAETFGTRASTMNAKASVGCCDRARPS